jgi:hypothetical protein
LRFFLLFCAVQSVLDEHLSARPDTHTADAKLHESLGVGSMISAVVFILFA